MSWGNADTKKSDKLHIGQNRFNRSISFVCCSVIKSFIGILALDNVFELKTAIFVYKILAETNDFPVLFDIYIEIVYDQQYLNTRFPNKKSNWTKNTN